MLLDFTDQHHYLFRNRKTIMHMDKSTFDGPAVEPVTTGFMEENADVLLTKQILMKVLKATRHSVNPVVCVEYGDGNIVSFRRSTFVQIRKAMDILGCKTAHFVSLDPIRTSYIRFERDDVMMMLKPVPESVLEEEKHDMVRLWDVAKDNRKNKRNN